MKKWEKSPDALVEIFDRVLPEDTAVERRKMFGYPCAFVNGNMFAGLFGHQMFVRLREDDRVTMIENKGAKPFEPMPGRVMKEYIVVTPDVLKRTQDLKRILSQALEFAKTIKPKKKRKK